MASIILQRRLRLAFNSTFTVDSNPRPLVYFIDFPRSLLFSFSQTFPSPNSIEHQLTSTQACFSIRYE